MNGLALKRSLSSFDVTGSQRVKKMQHCMMYLKMDCLICYNTFYEWHLMECGILNIIGIFSYQQHLDDTVDFIKVLNALARTINVCSTLHGPRTLPMLTYDRGWINQELLLDKAMVCNYIDNLSEI